MQKVLIIGYGKMGQVHGKHLSEMNVSWDYHDTFVSGGVKLNTKKYSHIIISTPIHTHYDVYSQLSSFTGDILIEKPVVCKIDHLEVLNDPRVFPGLVERYNPVTQHLLNAKDSMKDIHFIRHSLTGDIVDIGIHDIDLACLLFGCNYQIIGLSDDLLITKFNDVNVSFRWMKSNEKFRMSFSSNGLIVNFCNQSVNGILVDFCWPIKLELESFLSRNWYDPKIGYYSHKLMIECNDLYL